ncbi:MAG: diadenylate cyclase CdaA [Deltaproteobacteria bacterium]|nr:diadenylate cyclase CdaA [Deltaproteobacteria bacterium]MCL5791877.1 diadenylate cyclase CdaA [Deltaproteobacteria bacterium]
MLNENTFRIIKNIADILIVSYIIYRLLIMLKGSRAAQVIIGLFIIFGAYLISNFFDLTTLRWLLNSFLSSIVLIIIVVFQQDIKRALAYMGKGYFNMSNAHAHQIKQGINEVSDAVYELAKTKTGALIVFEKNIGIKEVVETGRVLDAIVTKELLLTLFNTNTPLHDGAAVIKGNRIKAAGCMLPLSQDLHYHPAYGTRHKAAFGLSQEADAVIVIVSEESGKVSVVHDSEIKTIDEQKSLQEELYKLMDAPV